MPIFVLCNYIKEQLGMFYQNKCLQIIGKRMFGKFVSNTFYILPLSSTYIEIYNTLHAAN